ncbi:MAG: DMT family transporter [Clostridia bacterium]
MIDKPRLRSNIILLVTAFIWGTAFVAQKAGEGIGSFAFIAIRNLLAIVVMLPIMFILAKRRGEKFNILGTNDPKGKKITLFAGVIVGLILFAGCALQQFGILNTDSVGKAGFITTLYIVLVPILGIFIKKKVNWIVFISVAISSVGLYLLCIDGEFKLSTGDLLLLGCALMFAIHILVVDHFVSSVNTIHFAWLQYAVCAVLGFIAMFIFEKPDITLILQAYFPLLYAGVLSSAIGFTLQIVAQKNMNPTVASLIMCLESVFSVLGGYVVFGDILTTRELIGCGMMFVAIILAQIPFGKPKLDSVK